MSGLVGGEKFRARARYGLGSVVKNSFRRVGRRGECDDHILGGVIARGNGTCIDQERDQRICMDAKELGLGREEGLHWIEEFF